MAYLKEALTILRNRALNTRDQGASFENLMCRALATHPGEYGSQQFAWVKPWNQWEGRQTIDVGIDLVAQDHDGLLHGIQCKFYSEDAKISAGVDSFLAALHNPNFAGRGIFVATTNNLTDIAQKKLEDAKVTLLTQYDLERWPIDDWREFIDHPEKLNWRKTRYQPHDYQQEAVDKVCSGLQDSGRGRLILPCGTGKSVVALWIAEKLVSHNGRILYLVPSIALMGQTMREWSYQKEPEVKVRYLAICSDQTAGQSEDGSVTELSIPPTTDTESILAELKRSHPDTRQITFCTYQSLAKVAKAQEQGAPAFDLIICDEAHRTTGVEDQDNLRPSEEINSFTLVHDNTKVIGQRRLYMTATPRIFTDQTKQKVRDISNEQGRDLGVFTMDDESVYGKELFRMSFGQAVNKNCLTDYKVAVICYDEESALAYQRMYKKTDLSLSDASRLLGCWDALADPQTTSAQGRITGAISEHHLKRAIAYTNTIARSKRAAEKFPEIVNLRITHNQTEGADSEQLLKIETKHIDGQQSAAQRDATLSWLKEDTSSGYCRIVTNARCLTEGVDVPDLDAVIFLNPKQSQIDIIQAVGRVMRKAANKELGYIVIPVIVPSDANQDNFLSSSEFNPVWQMVKALRAHDERVDIWVNNVNALQNSPVSIIDRTTKSKSQTREDTTIVHNAAQDQLSFDLKGSIASKLVEKCGDRQYWPKWGNRAAGISRRVTSRLNNLRRSNQDIDQIFCDFAQEMCKLVDASLANNNYEDLVEMLAHHIVTKPVFDSLFKQSDFNKTNPISVALERVVTEFLVCDPDISEETQPLSQLYQSVDNIMQGTTDAKDRLKLLLDMYESFFENAMEQEVKRLGIAYTPTELVDFTLACANAALKKHFGRELTSQGVNILDPFTGTGTFVYRLLTKNGLIADSDLERKYREEIHANEILLLPYYLASIKIEEGYRERLGSKDEQIKTTFDKLVLTDTFEMGARQSLFTDRGYIAGNSKRARHQNETKIVVIIGNPPWSAGQKSAGHDNQNNRYPQMADRVRETYGAKQKSITGKSAGGNSAGNLYVQSIRWASDRLAHKDQNRAGIIAFVHPNSLSDGTSLAGMRATLREEFTDIYVINLKGNAYKSGEERSKEGGVVFESSTRNGVQITILVKSLDGKQPANLYYANVPDRLSLKEKLEWLNKLRDINNPLFEEIPVNDSHDWVNITDGSFQKLMPLCEGGPKSKRGKTIIADHASGVKTNCDAYVYDFSYQSLVKKASNLIEAYETARKQVAQGISLEEATRNTNLSSIKWTDTLKESLRQNKEITFEESRIRPVLYRPFIKQWLYEDDRILSSVKTVSAMFPRETSQNNNTPPRSSYQAPQTYPPSPSSPLPQSTTSHSVSQQVTEPSPTNYTNQSRQPADIQLPDNNSNNRPQYFGESDQSSDANKIVPPPHLQPQPPQTLPSSPSSPVPQSTISRQSESTLPAEPSPTSYTDNDGQPTTIQPSSHDSDNGSPRPRSTEPDNSGKITPPPIVITSTNNRTIFGLTANKTLIDLCATGSNQPCRAIPIIQP